MAGTAFPGLKGHATGIKSAAFHPDEWRLAAAGSSKTVTLWDARPLIPEVRVERRALGLLEFLFDRLPTRTAVIAHFRGNQTISEDVRRQTLTWTKGWAKGRPQNP